MTDLAVDLNFVVPPEDPRSNPFPFATVVSTGKPLHIAPTRTTVHDLRPSLDFDSSSPSPSSKSESFPHLDEHGFEVVTLPYEPLETDVEEGWEDRYAREMAEWLRIHIGAKRVVHYNHQVRKRIRLDDPNHPQDFDPTKLQPSTVVHVDNSQRGAFKKGCSNLGLSLEEGRKERIATINLWRPLKGPVEDSPLALCDARTVRQKDLELTEDYYGEGTFVRHSPRHRWYYVRDMMPNEMILLRCFDSTKPPAEGGVTPHSAFYDEERSGPGSSLRQSIEVRCSVLY